MSSLGPGRTAFVTGGASGIGLAMARTFLAGGMNVVIADADARALERVEAALASERLLACHVDVTDRTAMAAAAVATDARFGPLHVLCNNAGVGGGGSIDQVSFADWDWTMGINVNGVINGVQTFVGPMLAHGQGGHIVNTVSLAGVLPVNGQLVYNTSKYAVLGLSESLRKDLAPHGIGVTALCPGFVATNIFNVRPPHRKPDAAEPVTQTGGLTEEQRDTRQRLVGQALDPRVVGIMVSKAIEQNLMYVFTHPEFASYVAARGERLQAGFAASVRLRSEAEAQAGVEASKHQPVWADNFRQGDE